ncbi:MAG: RNA polymerase sigma factor [Vicinamibacterales bacterium]
MNALPAAGLAPDAVGAAAPDRLGALVDAHYDRLYRLARRLAPSADDALDLVQETFLRAAAAPARVPGGEGEAPWLVRVLVNLRRDQWRREAVRRRAPPSAADAEDPEPALLARDAVWRALDRLSPRRRAVVVLHELDDHPVAAIAALLGLSRVTVRWHLAAARRDLARALAPKE